VPDARTGEAVDDGDAQSLRGSGRVLHFFNRPFVHAVGLAVSPDVFRKDRLVFVEDGLPDEVVRDGEQFEVILFQQLALAGAVRVFRQRLGHLEVVPPAGEFDADVTELTGLQAQLFEREVGPLAGK
jgi:hypothetical protein